MFATQAVSWVARLFGIVLLSVVMSGQAHAATLGPNCPFTYNNVCYDSLAEAESVMRMEPTGLPTGRHYLERDPTWEQVNDATQTDYIFRYRVLGRPGSQKAAWIQPWADAGSYWPVCYCDDLGRPKCFATGSFSSCSNNADLCTYKYRCPVQTDVVPDILNYMAAPGCTVSIVGTNPGPSGPVSLISAAMIGMPPSQTQPENSGAASYYDGNGVGQSITVARGGAGCATPRTFTYKYDKTAPIHCPAGLRPSGSNDFSKFCSSGVTGEIHAWVIPSEQCEVGNPCVPTTGAKIQPAHGLPTIGTSSASGGLLVYNSLQSSYEDTYLGENWTGVFASRLLFEKYGNGATIKYQNGRGNYEIFASAGNGRYRPVNRPGSSILKLTTNGGLCSYYTLHETGRRLVYGCAGTGGNGRLIRIEYPDSPAKDLTVIYAQKDLYDANGAQIAFAGTVQTVREATGREVEFLYGYINQSADCSTAVSPRACNALRLIAIVDSTDQITSFDYNVYGRVDTIHFPDGSSERYEYGKTEDICPSTIADGCTGPAHASLPPYLLTGVYRQTPGPNGTTFSTRIGTYQYDNRGRVLVSTHPGDAGKVQISYASNGVPTVRQFTDATHFSISTITTARYSMFDKPRIATTTGSSGGSVAYVLDRGYDSRGYMLSRTDARGVRTDTTIDPLGLMTQRIEAANDATGLKRTINIGWNPDFRLPTTRGVFDAAGNQLSQSVAAYDTEGHLVARCQVDPLNSAALAYVCGSAVDAPLGVRQILLDRCTAANAAAGTCAFAGQVLSVNGALPGSADTTSLEYYLADDPLCASAPTACAYRKGDLKRVVSWVGQDTAAVQIATDYLAYDGTGRVLTVRDANGVLTDFQYSPRGWLLKTAVRGLQDGIEDDDSVTEFEYDARGLVTKLTHPDHSFLSFEYDDADRLIKLKDTYGQYISYTLDQAGNSIVDETRTSSGVLKQKVSRAFDDLGRLQAIRNAANVSTDFTYANNGDTDTAIYPAASVGATPRVDDLDFDALQRLVTTVANRDGATSERATTSLTYDPLDRLVAVRDPKGLDTTYQYNALNDLTRLTSPDTGVTTYSHDAAGNLTQKVDANQVATTYTYDELGRLKNIQPGTDAAVNFTYDTPSADCTTSEQNGKARLATMSDESGSTRFCYDRFGHLVRKVQTVTGGTTPAGGTTLTLGATYDSGGRLVAMTYPSGAIATYLYNANGQINRIDVKPSAAAAQVTLISNVSYLPFGPRLWWIYGNGRSMTRAFDLDYNIDALNDAVPADGLYENYTLDSVGNVKGIVERTSIVRTYDHDGLGRLKAQKNGATTVEAFTYEPTGDRTTKTVGTTASYVYASDSHRLLSVNGAPRTYDGNGNTRTIGTAFELKYNKRNRLAEIYQGELPNRVLTRTHVYNGKGERVAKWYPTGPGNNTLFIYDESGHLVGEYNAAGYRVAEYVWMDDTLVGVLKDHDGSTYQYVEVDYLGTPRAIINPVTNKTVWRWDVTSAAAGSFGDGPVNNDPDANGITYNFNLRYPGQYSDGLAGINYNYFRDYDSTTGRYLQSDPLGLRGGINTYGYVGGAPLSRIDPLGLAFTSVDWACMKDPQFCLEVFGDYAGARAYMAQKLCDPEEQAYWNAVQGLFGATSSTITKVELVHAAATAARAGAKALKEMKENGAIASAIAPTKTDRLKNHVLNGELDAARREAAGEVVARKANGDPWDHVQELKDAQNGLLNRIDAINRELGNTRGISDSRREALLQELGEASRLLDLSEQYLPR